MSCHVTGTGSVNLKNEKKNCEILKQGEGGYCEPFKVSIMLATLKNPSPSVCVHFSGSQEKCSEIAALI